MGETNECESDPLHIPLTFLVGADADGPKLPITLNDVIGLNFMSPIESMDWVNDRFVTIKYSDSVEMLDMNDLLPKNFTLANTEALVRNTTC